MARPTLDRQIQRAAEQAGRWSVEHVARGVLLLAQADDDTLVPTLQGRRLTVLTGSRRRLGAVQRMFMDGGDDDVLVVDSEGVRLLALVLDAGTSDDAARAEFLTEPEPSPPRNGAGQNGVRPRPRPVAAVR